MTKKAIIIGASSGIGKALAEVLADDGYILGLTGRRLELLGQISDKLSSNCFVEKMDISKAEETKKVFQDLVVKMGEVDLVIISAGTGHINPELNLSLEQETIDVNVSGFTLIADLAFQHFNLTGKGHLVGISSIAGIRGGAPAPAYNASKAFVSNYLEGLRIKAFKDGLNILVTDIRPGFVDTDMAKGDNMFWLSSPEKAARQIVKAINKKRRYVYISKRWLLIAWLFKILPESIYKKL